MLVNKPIPNLFQGVSQQPVALRLNTQAELQENALSSIVEGLKKRPPTTHVAKLKDTTLSSCYVHTINRDANEKYVVILTDGDMEVYDLQGNKKTINFPHGKGYLSNPNPSSGFTCTTIADYTLIANKSITCGMVPVSSGSYGAVPVTITLSQADFTGANLGATAIYSFSFNGIAGVIMDAPTQTISTDEMGSQTVSYSYTKSATSLATELAALINSTVTGYSASAVGATVTVYPNGASSTLSVGHLAYINKENGTNVSSPGLITVGVIGGGLSDSSIAYFFVSAAPAQHSITAIVDGVSASASLGTSGGTQGGFAQTLATNLGTALGAGYVVSRPIPEIIKVTKLSGNINTLACNDTYGQYAIRCLNLGVQKYSDLPATFEEGMTIAVYGNADSNTDTYYVKWNGSSWIETIKPGEETSFDASTLPHKLVREADGTFTFSKITWGDRLVGDRYTNPNPSFIGRKISDIFFYRNRLGFCADENVILSKAGNFFTFWVDTITTPIDSDPIDVAVSSTKVSILKHAVPFNTQLLLFSDLSQFMVSTSANVVLTQKTITINPTTQYQINSLAKPVGIGQDVYFAADRGSHSAVMEYYVQPQTYTNDAAEVTAHVQKYIPSGIYKLIGSSIEDSLFALTTNEPNVIYAYKFYWGDENKKVQSAWSKWVLGSQDQILGGEIVDSKLYLTIQRSDGVYLEYMNLSAGYVDDDMGLCVHLDRKVGLTGSYDAVTGITAWTLPYQEPGAIQGILGASFGHQAGTVLTLTRISDSSFYAMGDHSGSTVWFGRPYTMRYRFTQFYFKDDKGIAVTQYNLKMKNIEIAFSNSCNFKVEVTPFMRETYTYKFTGKILGVNTVLGAVVPAYTGVFKVPLMSDSDGLVVDIVNDSWLPCALQSAEWNAKLSMNFRRV